MVAASFEADKMFRFPAHETQRCLTNLLSGGLELDAAGSK